MDIRIVASWLSVAAAIGGGAFWLADISGRVKALENGEYETAQTARSNALQAVGEAEKSALYAIDQRNQGSLNEIETTKQAALDLVNDAISPDGKITLGGVCFEPKSLIRCYEGVVRNDADHITWVGSRAERECTNQNPPRKIERRILILAECGKED